MAVLAGQTRGELVERFVSLRPRFNRCLVTKVLPPDLQAEVRSITIHQLEALDRLYPSGLTMGALARALEITDGSAAVLSDRLVKQGLAIRRSDVRDRRVVWLEPSEHALALVRRFRALERETLETNLRALDDRELTTLLDLLEKVASLSPRAECPR
ncbi:MAG TPA: MarR family transcriptional regulator [Chloroflexota bacterium]|nr:MarR family transcriptional regulator [Chloroflexota bacterium]